MERFIFVFLAVLLCGNVFAAQLVGNEITLCTNGYSADGSTCTPYDDGDCGTGYYDLTASATSFVAPSNNVCSTSGYKSRTLPDTTIALVYHGAVLGEEITLCNNGYSSNGSSCSTYSRGDCSDSSYYEIATNSTSFVAPNGNVCSTSGYKSRTLPNTTITMVYHGAVVGDEITLCNNGYSADGSSCTTYASSGCPSDFYNINTGAAAFAENNGSCASGYHQYIAENSCGFEPEGSTCINFCSGNELMTGAGGCSALCGEGATVFRVSTGLRYPLWATKQTTPSLNIGFANGNRCYVNLVSGHADVTAIHVAWDEYLYHATK